MTEGWQTAIFAAGVTVGLAAIGGFCISGDYDGALARGVGADEFLHPTAYQPFMTYRLIPALHFTVLQ